MIKPVAYATEKVMRLQNGECATLSATALPSEACNVALYAIPDTHQIMPVKLTDALIKAALPQLMREDDEDKYRALGQLICVWDALVEAEREQGND